MCRGSTSPRSTSSRAQWAGSRAHRVRGRSARCSSCPRRGRPVVRVTRPTRTMRSSVRSHLPRQRGCAGRHDRRVVRLDPNDGYISQVTAYAANLAADPLACRRLPRLGGPGRHGGRDRPAADGLLVHHADRGGGLRRRTSGGSAAVLIRGPRGIFSVTPRCDADRALLPRGRIGSRGPCDPGSRARLAQRGGDGWTWWRRLPGGWVVSRLGSTRWTRPPG